MEIQATGNTGLLAAFEMSYTATRKKEERLYPDDIVAKLPFIGPTHIHFSEWLVRNRSAQRLLSYLRTKQKPLRILDVGCGNGWLTAMLAAIDDSSVTGIDINTTELQQARRVFGDRPNLRFLTGQPGDAPIWESYDVIVFAASIQYFPSLTDTLNRILPILNKTGEVHIFDTHFYSRREQQAAQQRSEAYYRSIGQQAMVDFYFHHAKNELAGFNYTYLFNPYKLGNRLIRKKDPFPWIRITA